MAELAGRLKRNAPRLVVTCARGSSAHAATFGKHLIERHLGIPVAAAAPNIASLLTRIEAARRQSDPNSLLNRPARVYLVRVSGAPGDGNDSLTVQMRQKLPGQGTVGQDPTQGVHRCLTA